MPTLLLSALFFAVAVIASPDDDAVCEYRFDSLSRVLDETQRDNTANPLSFTTSAHWRSFGRQTALIYNSGRTITRTFDDLDRYASYSYSQAANELVDETYIGGRPLTCSINEPGLTVDYTGLATTTTYDKLRRTLAKKYTGGAPGSTQIEVEYGYDETGNRLFARHNHDPFNSQAYEYDSSDRLTKFERGQLNSFTVDDTGQNFTATPIATYSASPAGQSFGKQSRDWTFDGVSNWREDTVVDNSGSPSTSTRDVSELNEYETVGADSLKYDLNGNLVQDNTYDYRYDALNRLRFVILRSTGTIVGQYL
ncbi:MAG: hypothetical protein NUW37_07500, partial [Planctomycetes bacterium]|nr:hypothetical protein [Planctomycetota bacterium]